MNGTMIKGNRNKLLSIAVLSCSLYLGGCSPFWTGFARGVAGDTHTEATSTQEEKAGQLVGEGAKEAVETLPFGKILTGLVALIAASYALKKKGDANGSN